MLGVLSAQRSLDWVGVIALIGGLALLISFFLPWFGVHVTCSGRGCLDLAESPETLLVDSSASAFRLVGSGFSVYYAVADIISPLEIFSPAMLWLVLLASIALIAVAICMLQGALSSRPGRWLIVLAAALALVVEVVYLFSAFGAFPEARQHTSGNFHLTPSPAQPPLMWMLEIATGPSYGFWIGLVATIAAGAGALFVRQAAVPGGVMAPVGQPSQFPGAAPTQWPQPAQGPVGPVRAAQRPGLPGLAALFLGLAMVIGFFLPWLTTPDFSGHILFSSLALGNPATPPTNTHSGWEIVNGVALFDPAAGIATVESYPLRLFPQFWLVLLSGALLVIAWLLSRGRFSARAASTLLFGVSLVVLLLELGLLLQVQALQTDFAMRLWPTLPTLSNKPGAPPVLFGVSWGFWLSVAVSAAGVILGAFSLLRVSGPNQSQSMKS